MILSKDEKDRCKYLRQVRSKERILSTGSNQEESGDPRKWIGGQNQSPEPGKGSRLGIWKKRSGKRDLYVYSKRLGNRLTRGNFREKLLIRGGTEIEGLVVELEAACTV